MRNRHSNSRRLYKRDNQSAAHNKIQVHKRRKLVLFREWNCKECRKRIQADCLDRLYWENSEWLSLKIKWDLKRELWGISCCLERQVECDCKEERKDRKLVSPKSQVVIWRVDVGALSLNHYISVFFHFCSCIHIWLLDCLSFCDWLIFIKQASKKLASVVHNSDCLLVLIESFFVVNQSSSLVFYRLWDNKWYQSSGLQKLLFLDSSWVFLSYLIYLEIFSQIVLCFSTLYSVFLQNCVY